MFSVVTSFGRKGYELYGRDFIRTFKQFWPEEVKLIVYWEDEKPEEDLYGYDLLTLEPCASFLARHDNMIMRGKEPHPRWGWGPKASKSGYNFRFDAYKFSRKVFAVAHAAREVKSGRMFWIDADVVTHNRVKTKWLIRMLPEDIALCYLARVRYHSELGFVGYNLSHPDTHPFIEDYERQYADDLFINHGAFDDCNTFDMLVRRRKPAVYQIPNRSTAQPFDHSDLVRFMTHNKGNRKGNVT